MNRLMLLAIGIVLVGGAYLFFKSHSRGPNAPVESVAQGWRPYLPTSEKFSVAFPELPQHATDTVSDATTQQLRHYEMYVAEEGNGATYMINMITYPSNEDLSEHSAIFKRFIDDMVASNPQNKLLSSTASTFQGFDAWDFNIQNNEGELKSKMFFDDKNKTLYVLSRLAKPNIPDQGEFDKFITSFKLKNPTQ